jgi:DNA invertase Pin-like site-specific DNA recombinase
MTLKSTVRCAIYTRVSTEQGLEQDFNSLDAQYDASQAYIRSQAIASISAKSPTRAKSSKVSSLPFSMRPCLRPSRPS